MSDATMSDVHSDSSKLAIPIDPRDPANYCIHDAPDWGTSTFSGAYLFVLNGTEPNADETQIVQLEDGRDEIPQTVAIVCNPDRTWRLAWRKELESLLVSGQHHPDIFVFQRLKFLIDIREAFTAALIDAVHTKWSREQLARMQVHTFFPVPEITTYASRKTFKDIVRNAGFANATLVAETEAAAAWRVHEMSKDWLQHVHLTSGSKVVIADGGGLTLNAARYTIRGSVTDGAALRMDPDGSPIGTDCGSELLTMRCQHYARMEAASKYGDFDTCLEDLGLSKEEFDRAVAEQFNAMKEKFLGAAPPLISPEGVSNNGAAAKVFDVRISRQLLQSWFKETLDRIVTILDQLVDRETTMLLFTGGLLRSQYLVDNLKKIYRPKGIQVPDSGTQLTNATDTSVVKGALARFIVRPVQADPTLCLGIIEKSPYNSELQAEIPRDEVSAAEAGTPSYRIAKLDGELYALDRFRTILAPDAFVGSRNLDEAVGLWQEFSVPADKPTLETVVYETRANNPDNASIFNPNLDLQDGISVYTTVERNIDEATMKKYQYRLPSGRGGPKHYRVIARLRATGTWPDVSLEWVLGPGKAGRNGQIGHDASQLSAMPEDRMTQLGTDELHNGLFPATMQRNRHDVLASEHPVTPMAAPTMAATSLQEHTPSLSSRASSPLFVPEDSPLASKTAGDRMLEQFETEDAGTPEADPQYEGRREYPTPPTGPRAAEPRKRRRHEEPDTTDYEALAKSGKLPRPMPKRNGLPRVKTLVPKSARRDVYDGP